MIHVILVLRETQKLALNALTATDATSMNNLVNSFDAAYVIAVDPTARTAFIVAAKVAARTAAEQVCRQLAIVIKYNAGISDPEEIAVGARPVNPDRDRIDVLDRLIRPVLKSDVVRYSGLCCWFTWVVQFGPSSYR